jgi:hypothetical protein
VPQACPSLARGSSERQGCPHWTYTDAAGGGAPERATASANGAQKTYEARQCAVRKPVSGEAVTVEGASQTNVAGVERGERDAERRLAGVVILHADGEVALCELEGAHALVSKGRVGHLLALPAEDAQVAGKPVDDDRVARVWRAQALPVVPL